MSRISRLEWTLVDFGITSTGAVVVPIYPTNPPEECEWVAGNSESTAVVFVLLTLDPEEIVHFARERGLPEDPAALAGAPEVHDLLQGILDDVNRRYAQAEQIKRFVVLDHDLSLQTGELTPTLKAKRNVVDEKYAGLFDELYAEEAGSP